MSPLQCSGCYCARWQSRTKGACVGSAPSSSFKLRWECREAVSRGHENLGASRPERWGWASKSPVCGVGGARGRTLRLPGSASCSKEHFGVIGRAQGSPLNFPASSLRELKP